MPNYSYRCTACEHAFDAQQAFTDDALTECPQCSGKLRKLFNTVGVTFNGSGFYRTDSRAGSSTGGSGDAGGSTASSESSSSSSSSTSGSSTSTSTAAAS